MKITKSFLKKLIAEEVRRVIEDKTAARGEFTRGPRRNARISGSSFAVYEGSIDGIPAYEFVAGQSPATGGPTTDSAVLTIEQSFEDVKDFAQYLVSSLNFQTVSPRDYVASIGMSKLRTLMFDVTRKAQNQNQSSGLTPSALRLHRVKKGYEDPEPNTFTDQQPARVQESDKPDNEIILEAHRKGRKLSPAVKKLWWLEA